MDRCTSQDFLDHQDTCIGSPSVHRSYDKLDTVLSTVVWLLWMDIGIMVDQYDYIVAGM